MKTLLELQAGKTYQLKTGETIEFSRLSRGKEWAIVHPPGEPDMQSSFCVQAYEFVDYDGPAEVLIDPETGKS